MKQKINASIILVLIMAIAFIACNSEAKKEEPAKTETATMPPYDAAMDPLKVEAANITNKFADTLGVKFYQVDIKPGDSVAFHTHPDHLVYVMDGGLLKLMSKGGTWQDVEFKTGMGVMTGPDTHTGKNVGTTTIKLIVADIYRPRS
jgi:quercetin dioxygenase-like cupin family protein